MEPISLLNLNSDEIQKFLDSFDHVFSDCDGVIWTNKALDGIGEFFKIIKKLGKTVNYISNNSMRPRENYEAMFQNADIDDGYENLTVPAISIAEYLKSVNFDKNKYVYCVTCPETWRTIESYGYKCKNGPDLGPEFYLDYEQYLEDDVTVGAVVFDSDFRVNIAKLYRAITYLRRSEVHFLCGATERHTQFRGVDCLGGGAFTKLAIEEAKREPIVLAKPGKLYGEIAMKRFGVTDPGRVLFIGDMIEQDVGLGKACGFKTLLVLTSFSEEDVKKHDVKPDYFAPSLGSLVPLLKKQCI